jgi:hypothetical protein
LCFLFSVYKSQARRQKERSMQIKARVVNCPKCCLCLLTSDFSDPEHLWRTPHREKRIRKSFAKRAAARMCLSAGHQLESYRPAGRNPAARANQAQAAFNSIFRLPATAATLGWNSCNLTSVSLPSM